MVNELSEEMQEVLAMDKGILDAFGIEVLRVENGTCEISSCVPDTMVNAGGYAHGSIVYSLMDTACAYALRSKGRRGVTVHGDVNYMRGGQAGTIFRAVVKVSSLTRRVATLRGEVFVDLEGEPSELAAHGSFVFQLVVDK